MHTLRAGVLSAPTQPQPIRFVLYSSGPSMEVNGRISATLASMRGKLRAEGGFVQADGGGLAGSILNGNYIEA
jgi:hypothetical protein